METPSHKFDYVWNGEPVEPFDVALTTEQAKEVYNTALATLDAAKDRVRSYTSPLGADRKILRGNIGCEKDFEPSTTHMNLLYSESTGGAWRVLFHHVHSDYNQENLSAEKTRKIYVIECFGDMVVEAVCREYAIRSLGEFTVEVLFGRGTTTEKTYQETRIAPEDIPMLCSKIRALSVIS